MVEEKQNTEKSMSENKENDKITVDTNECVTEKLSDTTITKETFETTGSQKASKDKSAAVRKKKIPAHRLEQYFEKYKAKISPLLEKRADWIEKFQKNLYFKCIVIGMISLLLLCVLLQAIHRFNINRGETPKYVVDQFVSKLRVSMEHEDSVDKNLFAKGKRVQLYGPIVRIKGKVVYMEAEDCILEIAMSGKKEISNVILGKQYKIEATISDVSGIDEALYFKRGIFLEPLPSSLRK